MDLKRQIEGHLLALKSAGVEWLGKSVPLPQPAAPAVVDKRRALQMLAEEVAGCQKCAPLAASRRQTVFSDGSPDAEICFLGEAPGEDEDRQGLPFVGAAGQLLDKIIAACGLERSEVYICNILKCHPPANRTPQPDEAHNCLPYLQRQLAVVQPKTIVCLGGTAAKYLLNTTKSLRELRGKFHEYQGIKVMVTYHPSYLLPHRDPSKKKEVWQDMQWLMAQLGRTIPPRSPG